MGNVLVARDGSAWAYGAVVMRRGVLQYLMGSLEVGSVVTWRRVAKSLMGLPRGWLRRHEGKGSVSALKRRIVCVPKFLMGSPEAGSVVTWRRVPKF